ncbi:MAG: response regulator [Chloroflexota bacterium]
MANILIVDDEFDILDYLADKVRQTGHRVETAVDGVDALLKVIQDPDLEVVVMDIRMPRLDGMDALRILKEMNPEMPVIMFTGQAGRGDMALSVQLGAYTCMAKPISSEKLLETIKTVLSTKI